MNKIAFLTGYLEKRASIASKITNGIAEVAEGGGGFSRLADNIIDIKRGVGIRGFKSPMKTTESVVNKSALPPHILSALKKQQDLSRDTASSLRQQLEMVM